MLLPFPGVKEGLDILKESGYQMAVVTSKIRTATYKALNLLELTSYFSCLVCFEDTTNHKPDSHPILKALEGLGLSPKETVMIGDSPYDIQCAHAAGVTCGIVRYTIFPDHTWNEHKPDFWLNTIEEYASQV